MGKSKKSTIFAPENCEEALDIVIRQCDNWADNEDYSTTLMAAGLYYTTIIWSMKPTEINPTEIEEVFVPSGNISFDNYFSLIKDLNKLTIDIYSLEENESFNIIFLYEHKLVDRFMTIGRTIFSYIYQDDIF